MLDRPVKTSVVDKDMDFVIVSAMSSGRRVPRSPSDPDSSDSGEERIVLTLCRCDGKDRRR